MPIYVPKAIILPKSQDVQKYYNVQNIRDNVMQIENAHKPEAITTMKIVYL